MKDALKNMVVPQIVDTLNDEQKECLSAWVSGLKDGSNFFFTGKAGTGKSYLEEAYAELCALNNISLIKCAFTGVAATTIKGVTLHSLLKLQLGVTSPKLSEVQLTNAKNMIAGCDVIIVDEISMVRVDMFSNLVSQIKAANEMREKRCRKPIQLIVCGDFAQLKPVVKNEDRDVWRRLTKTELGDGCCFRADVWKAMNFKVTALSKCMRQADQYFSDLLSRARIGDVSSIREISEKSAKSPVKGGIWLCGKNAQADSINKKQLSKLEGEEFVSIAEEYNASIKDTNLEKELHYKNGARVIVCMNGKDEDTGVRFCNGSLGTIIKCGRGYAVVRLDRGGTVTMRQVEIAKFKTEIVNGVTETVPIGYVRQLPFKLGYAITIHKAQGQTYDRVNIIPEIFAEGQLYVALSRCTSLENMFIMPDKNGEKLKDWQLMTDKDTVEFIRACEAEYMSARKTA